MLVRMPKDYLNTPERAPFWLGRRTWAQKTVKDGKNLLGVALVATGVGISPLPGIPGKGVFTILLGVMLLDIPGKRRVERRILGTPKVLALVNRLRAGFDQPPLRIHSLHQDAVPAQR